MRIAIAATSALALALTTPLLAQGNGNGKGNAAASQGDPGNGKGRSAENKRNERRGPPADRGNGKGGPKGNERGASRSIQRGNDGRAPANVRQRVEREVVRQVDDRQRPRIERRVRQVVDRIDDRDIRRTFTRYDRDYRPVRNFCPPGLAKKGNGCQPPGQARKLASQRFDGYYRSAYSRLSGDDWRYYDGYAYRPSGGGLIESLIPLVGGVLFSGNRWPDAYDDYRAPSYYGAYYGRGSDYDYYYADQTLFSVDPEDRAITGIAALLTGDDINVGQPLPAGYDVYNVPYRYRDRYRDGPDAYYRYSDGYVYEVDPETRLVAAAIELLT
ncbi:hypothetical protein [Qipengyuania sp. JC766]|uniref:hypothetical protein n=1 Tax=Qipengyuania sp. JC766 TaxID=3232139 RepID=UPI0034576FFB